jgi:hypothetical protein
MFTNTADKLRLIENPQVFLGQEDGLLDRNSEIATEKKNSPLTQMQTPNLLLKRIKYSWIKLKIKSREFRTMAVSLLPVTSLSMFLLAVILLPGFKTASNDNFAYSFELSQGRDSVSRPSLIEI